MEKIEFIKPELSITATLHEPCKTAYAKLDSSHRDILNRIPCIKIKEMESPLSCCGSGGYSYYREKTAEHITEKRIDEAIKNRS